MLNCPNLQELFGKKYKITYDEALEPRVRSEVPWMMQLPCKGAGVTVYPHGEDTLAVEVNNRKAIRAKLLAAGLQVWQDGDTEATFLFNLAKAKEVFKIIKPRTVRQMTAAQRAGNAVDLVAARAAKAAP